MWSILDNVLSKQMLYAIFESLWSIFYIHNFNFNSIAKIYVCTFRVQKMIKTPLFCIFFFAYVFHESWRMRSPRHKKTIYELLAKLIFYGLYREEVMLFPCRYALLRILLHTSNNLRSLTFSVFNSAFDPDPGQGNILAFS